MATVHLNGTLRDVAGRKAIDVNAPAGATVADVLARLAAEAPLLAQEILTADGHLRDHIVVFRNGRNIRLLQYMQTPVAPDQTLELFPKIGVYRVLGGYTGAQHG
jgi:molybdopterin synthase sulfur carrier subunit